jgi:hypothetical protein
MTDLLQVVKPGLYPDIPEDAYHADPVPEGSLSVSGAKLLLPPSCPAKYDYQRRHPKAPTDPMQLGTVVHGLVLGNGRPVDVLPYENYQTKKAQQHRDEAIASGRVPLLTAKYTEAQAIADAVMLDELAGGLFAEGDAEQSLFWRDPEHGIWLRGRVDWLTYFDGFPCIVDLKTSADASPQEFARSVDKYRYYMQDPHYRDGLGAVLGCDPDQIDFLFAVVETEPPYLVMTHRVELEDVELGRQCNAIAREIYHDCAEANVWPKWSQSVNDLPLPPYARRRIESEINDYHD